MLKRYTFWLTAAVIFQFLTGVVHSISLFVDRKPANDVERQMNDLITNYRIDAGAGFHPSFYNLFTALSSSFTFLCLLAGATLGYLLLKQVDPRLMRGMIAINLAIFLPMLVVFSVLTFLPPIVCTGLIVVNLLLAFLTVPKIESTV